MASLEATISLLVSEIFAQFSDQKLSRHISVISKAYLWHISDTYLRISIISQVYFCCISDISRAFIMHIIGLSQIHLWDVSGIYQVYPKCISQAYHVHQAYIRPLFGISFAYIMYVLGISQPYHAPIMHIVAISHARIMHILAISQSYLIPDLCETYPRPIKDVSITQAYIKYLSDNSQEYIQYIYCLKLMPWAFKLIRGNCFPQENGGKLTLTSLFLDVNGSGGGLGIG